MATARPQPSSIRAKTLAELEWESRRLPVYYGLLNRSVAARLGINTTDLEILGILSISGPVSLSYLADVTGLASGTITLVADRLESAGFVRRTPDPDDRRKLRLEPVLERMRDAGGSYDRLESATRDLLDAYSQKDLDVVARFLGTFNDALRDAATISSTPES